LLKLIPHYFTKSIRQNYNKNLYSLVLWIAFKLDKCNKFNEPLRRNVKVTDPSLVSNIQYDSTNFNLHFIHSLFKDLKNNNKFICFSQTQQYVIIYLIGCQFRSLYHHQAIFTYNLKHATCSAH
jgi:hypothetical protein